MTAALPFGLRRQQHFLNNQRQGVRLGFNRACQRIAAQGAEADFSQLRPFAWMERQTVIVNHNEYPVTLYNRPFLGKVQWNDQYVFTVDILPDIQLGPVR